MRWLDTKGVEFLLPRQGNVIARAATMIVDEFNKDERRVTPGMGLAAWLDSAHPGLAGVFMARTLCRIAGSDHVLSWPASSMDYYYPHDPSDFGRCLGLLEAVPPLREHLSAMASTGPEWRELVKDWDVIERMYHEEVPGGSAPRCYAVIQAALNRVQQGDK